MVFSDGHLHERYVFAEELKQEYEGSENKRDRLFSHNYSGATKVARIAEQNWKFCCGVH